MLRIGLIFLSLFIYRLSATEEFLVKLPENFSTNLKKNRTRTNTVFFSEYFNTHQVINIAAITSKKSVMANWFLLQVETNDDIDFAALERNGKILNFQENHVLKLRSVPPNDNYYNDQWYHKRVEAAAAWNLYTPKRTVIVALIDTGIDYLHDDLSGSLWINENEDMNGNGQLDSLDLNGIDDDGNGYIDDVIGWDFTDARRFPDTGDFQTPDNDPMEAFPDGHGTEIAGIIAAQTNNAIGIAGLVPACRVMNLRAATSEGYLEEDDVARAIIYAVENNADIINMSFGDVVVSPFLEEVINYAYDEGLVLVASAGNDGSRTIQYPAGFARTISAGATDRDNQRCSFSNWGQTIDVVAPGVEIISTAPHNSYREVQGTSFSAPIVSAAAAQVLSRDLTQNNEQVRNLLKTCVVDLGPAGWDEVYGSGLINMRRLAGLDMQAKIVIHYPASGSSTASDSIPLVVTIQNPDLKKAVVAIGIGENPDQWETLSPAHFFQVIEDTLCWIDLSGIEDSSIVIRLTITEISGVVNETRSLVHIDRTPAVLSSATTKKLISDDHRAILLEFSSDDIATASLKYKQNSAADNFSTLNLPYRTTNHKILFEPEMGTGTIEYYFEVVNLSGLETISDHSVFSLENEIIPPVPAEPTNRYLPPGFLLNSATDFNHDNQQELVLSLYDANFNYGPVQIFEFTGEKFEQRLGKTLTAIPRSWGDSDGDGKSELLAGYGNKSYLLEALSSDTFPETIIWQDTINFWASRITDLDNDGNGELLGRIEGQYVLLEAIGDNAFRNIFTFENPTPGENRLGPPTTVVTDLDKDGFPELVFGDYDGDVVIYENSGNNMFDIRFEYRLPFPDATDYMIAGYFLDNETPCLIIGCHTKPAANFEHEFEAQYWHFENLTAQGNNNYQVNQQFDIYGYITSRQFDSGWGSITLPGEEVQTLVLAPFPNLYLFNGLNMQLQPTGYLQGVRTNRVVSCDLDKNGSIELYFNTGQAITGYETGDQIRPQPPPDFTAFPVDSSAINLEWIPVSGAAYYRIFRGISADQLVLFDSTSENNFHDTNVILDERYYYALQSVDLSFEQQLSLLSRIQSARANYPPRLNALNVSSGNDLKLSFSEQMDQGSFLPHNFGLQNENNHAISSVALKNGWGVLISFFSPFQDNKEYILTINHIQDMDRTQIDTRDRRVSFLYHLPGEIPYITKWELTKERNLMVCFNVPMDTVSVMNREHYTIDPQGAVDEIYQMDDDAQGFEIHLNKQVFLGGSGIDSYITFNGIRSRAGILFEDGNRLSLVTIPEELDNLYVYPQPVRLTSDWIMFANVIPSTKIDIFDMHGYRIRHLEDNQKNGGIRWDLQNDNGERVASGVYFYYAYIKSKKKMGKLVVVR